MNFQKFRLRRAFTCDFYAKFVKLDASRRDAPLQNFPAVPMPVPGALPLDPIRGRPRPWRSSLGALRAHRLLQKQTPIFFGELQKNKFAGMFSSVSYLFN